MPVPPRRWWKQWGISALVAVAVAVYYLWGVRAATGAHFEWRQNLGGYYNYLARGFMSGHLYVPIEPSPVLLGMPNPWDPAIDDSYKMQDMALFSRHYYLYFGVAPAALLFWPWRLVTGHDLPESFALFLLCLGGFLFSASALVRLLDIANSRPGGTLLGIYVLALGVCQSVPYLLNRPAVYEVAIASGYCFLSAAVFCLTYWNESRGAALWMAASGLLFGLAMASRPHLALAAVVTAVFLGVKRGFFSRPILAFGLAFATICLAVGVYNQQRFGNLFEFGFRYQLSGPGQNQINLNPRNLLPGLYFLMLRPPDFSPVFPWIHMVFRHSYEQLERLPPHYFYEPTVGALWTAPFLLGLVFLPRKAETPRFTAAAAATVLLFLANTHLVTHRYEVDFVPLTVMTSIATVAICRARATGFNRRLAGSLIVLAIVFSATVNLALGFSGPYDDLLRNRPAAYVHIARWFSPFPKTRPLLDPDVQVAFRAQFTNHESGLREPLVTMGGTHHGWCLYVEHLPGALRIVSQTETSHSSYDWAPEAERAAAFRVTYSRRTSAIDVELNERTVLRQPQAILVTAPAEVLVGEDAHRGFTGRIDLQKRQVVANLTAY